MKYLVTAQEMKQYDKNTIEYLGIPGPVLMERAALAAEDFIKERFDAVKERTKVLIFAGMGNNGGDGLALARLLAADGYAVAVKCVGDMQRATKQWKSQWQTLQHFPVKTDSNIAVDEYNVIVDALFGVGLSRPVEGNYADAVKEMNKAEGFKLALDVPSGICSDTGRVLGCAFLADATVTFGFCKRGLVLYPGAEYAGEVRTANVGIGPESFLGQEPEMYTYEKGSVQLIKRNAAGNKGTFGKALLVAGSNGMAGAAILAAKAAYRTGAGMVKVITAEENRQIIQQGIPEALYGSCRQLTESLDWADVIAIGPGIGREEQALQCLKTVVERSRKPLVLDADALNLLAEENGRMLAEELRAQGEEGRVILLTPHVGEMSRLLKRYKWRKKRKKAFVLFICIVGICFLVTRMVRVEDKTTVKVHNMHTEQNEKAIRYVASNMIKEDPKIAITFDDGPSPVWTPQLLDGLKERNVKATFFLIGENAKNNPELVKREAEEGHLIGNHTYHHVEITRVPDETAQEEILMTNEVITGITGEEVSYMRPPFGVWQKNLERKLDVMPVLWTIDPLDWTTDNEDEIINKVVTQAGENDIILLHDCYESSVNAALRIVDILQKEGFGFVTVDELIMN